MIEEKLSEENPFPAQPVQPGERITVVDVLRGFAVFGILAANMASYSGHETNLVAPLATIDRYVLVAIRFLITAKFYSLFSFLFGWGMSVQMSRAEARGKSFGKLYLRRLFVLLLFGLLHAVLIWDGDILTVYALLGLLLFIMRKISERRILIALSLCLLLSIVLTAPWEFVGKFIEWYQDRTALMHLNLVQSSSYTSGTYYEISRLRLQDFLNRNSNILLFFGNVFSMFLLGLYVGKRKILHEVENNLGLLRNVLVGGLLLGALCNGFVVWIAFHPEWVPADWFPGEYQRMLQRTFYTIGAPALMLFYASGITLLYRKPYWKSQLAPLANVGRMALSNYIFQSIIGTLLFYNYGLGLFGEISPTVGLILSVIIFLFQIRISEWWFDRYRYGPLEWIWRVLTYAGKLQEQKQTAGEPRSSGWWSRLLSAIQRIPPGTALAGIWVILLIWGGILLAWNKQIEARRQAPSLRLVSNSTVVSPNSEAIRDETIQDNESGSPELSIPTWSQEAYQPGPIVESGDMEALAGTFDIDHAIHQIKTLTGPPYNGRLAGSPQGNAAAEYIAEQFAQFGLQPLGDEGSYFQHFSVRYTPLTSTPRLFTEDGAGALIREYSAYQDFSPVVRWYAGSGSGQGAAYWANKCAENDLVGADVSGKVLICLAGTEPNWLAQIMRRSLERGAVALLVLNDPISWPPNFGWAFKEVWVPEPIPVFYVYPSMVESLLMGSGLLVDDLVYGIPSFPINAVIGFEIQTQDGVGCPGSACPARNVLGILPGRDPDYAGEAIILGAHFDHMGETPNGIVWTGANDDASGVAVLLEIARSWRQHGYVPRRSVIFAAWDAEELGLLGAQHYVSNPPYPLDQTIAMIQLDMVGVGSEILGIDGPTLMGTKIEHIAESLGNLVESSNSGRSDHEPFIGAGIAANALSWVPQDGESVGYHRPLDTIDNIKPGQLQRAAQITILSTLSLAESEPSLQELLAARARAAEDGDVGAFLATSTSDQIQADLYWFNDLQSYQPVSVDIEVDNLKIAGNLANALAKTQINYIDTTDNTTRTLRSNMVVSLVNNSRGWQWAGPKLEWVADTSNESDETQFEVAYPEGGAARIAGLEHSAREIYKELTSLLGLPSEVEARLLILPNQEALRASTALSIPSDQDTWVIPGEVKLVLTEDITTSLRLKDALAQLVLAEAGVNETNAPWLWQGLPLAIQSYYQPVTAQIRHVPRLQTALEAAAPAETIAGAWAATIFLQERLGWTGLGNFIITLGDSCRNGCDEHQALDAVLVEYTGRNTAEFEAAWQGTWSNRLTDAQNKLDQSLEERAQAITNGNLAAFIETIDQNIPNLATEERHWLEEWLASSATNLSLSGHPIAFLEDGSLLAEIEMSYQPGNQASGGSGNSFKFVNTFTLDESGYKWAGPEMEALSSEQIEILYPAGEIRLASTILESAGRVYSELAGLFALDQREKLTLKLYDAPAAFRASIPINYSIRPPNLSWTGDGESLKLLIEGGNMPGGTDFTLARLISRNLLFQIGLDSGWLLDGISAYLSRSYMYGESVIDVSAEYTALYNAAVNHTLTALDSTPPITQLTGEALDIYQSQAWDAVEHLLNEHGWEAVVTILKETSAGISIERAFQTATGKTIAEFEQAWLASLLERHINLTWLATIQDFDSGSAMETVTILASPNFAGRRTGSPGGERAMEYIADKFIDYGLLPAGDQISQTLSISITQAIIQNSSPLSNDTQEYFQTFSISYSLETAAPMLEIITVQGEPLTQFIYRQDFNIIQGGVASAALVWGGNTEFTRTDLDGKIILRTTRGNLTQEIDNAVGLGAGGLLIASTKYEPNQVFSKDIERETITTTTKIPVFELTQAGYSKLLETLGHDRQSIAKLPLYQPLGQSIRIVYQPPGAQTANTANVLGYLPGSDPFLGKEIVIIGAHYDHVGDDPGGLRYSGANDDASGVSVLLEIARLLQEINFRPKRSILFAAWGAQELGQIGSNYYINNPRFPLQDTIAMIQLDGVGGGDGFNLGVQGSELDASKLLFYLRAAENALGEKLVYTNPQVESDQTPFQQKGIPAVLISWRLANEFNMPDDFANAVRPERLGVTGKVTTILLLALAR